MKRKYITIGILALTIFSSTVAIGMARGPKSETYSWVDHTVVYGETIGGLAERYGSTVGDITEDNGIWNANVVMPGTKLSIRVKDNSSLTQ